ncbi:MAG: hypothetical protein ACR2LM_08920 [Pyrinomonadaceae bacterium]
MAIGWGKSYEDQMEEWSQRLAKAERGPRLTSEQRTRMQRLESLKLSRSRTLEQLERSKHPAHREGLLKGLQAIEKQLEEVIKESEAET